jgi:hypothetical protein
LAATYDISSLIFDRTNRTEKGPVTQFNVDDVVFAFHLNPSEHLAAAARCARLALRILDHVSFPVPPVHLEVLNNAVQHVEKAAAGTGDGTELDTAMNEAGRIAFANLPYSRFRPDRITGYVAHAIYAATLACLTGSRGCLEDAFIYTLEAVSTAQASDLGTSIRQELCLIRKEAGRSSDGPAARRVPPELAPA